MVPMCSEFLMQCIVPTHDIIFLVGTPGIGIRKKGGWGLGTHSRGGEGMHSQPPPLPQASSSAGRKYRERRDLMTPIDVRILDIANL